MLCDFFLILFGTGIIFAKFIVRFRNYPKNFHPILFRR
jgi:hypothetical protein